MKCYTVGSINYKIKTTSLLRNISPQLNVGVPCGNSYINGRGTIIYTDHVDTLWGTFPGGIATYDPDWIWKNSNIKVDLL